MTDCLGGGPLARMRLPAEVGHFQFLRRSGQENVHAVRQSLRFDCVSITTKRRQVAVSPPRAPSLTGEAVRSDREQNWRLCNINGVGASFVSDGPPAAIISTRRHVHVWGAFAVRGQDSSPNRLAPFSLTTRRPSRQIRRCARQADLPLFGVLRPCIDPNSAKPRCEVSVFLNVSVEGATRLAVYSQAITSRAHSDREVSSGIGLRASTPASRPGLGVKLEFRNRATGVVKHLSGNDVRPWLLKVNRVFLESLVEVVDTQSKRNLERQIPVGPGAR